MLHRVGKQSRSQGHRMRRWLKRDMYIGVIWISVKRSERTIDLAWSVPFSLRLDSPLFEEYELETVVTVSREAKQGEGSSSTSPGLSMAATERVIWLCSCVMYWLDSVVKAATMPCRPWVGFPVCHQPACLTNVPFRDEGAQSGSDRVAKAVSPGFSLFLPAQSSGCSPAKPPAVRQLCKLNSLNYRHPLNLVPRDG